MPLFANQYGLRRLADKARRRLRRLVGRPDNTPWVLDGHIYRRTAHADFVFGLDYLSPNSALVKMLHEASRAYGVSILPVNRTSVEQVTRDIADGWLRPHVYLDLCSRPGDAFETLLHTAAHAGIHTIARPEHLTWGLKAYSHPRLAAAGLPVPPSVIIRSDEPDRDLTPAERRFVGERCVIKPSYGWAGHGVVVNVEPTRDAIAAAREINRADDWLVQKMMSWTSFGDRPAYLRAYNVLGQRTLMWWRALDEGQGGYEMLSWDEFVRYDLLGAVQLTDRIAELTGMEFFSSEVAILSESGPNRFCLIDYINDQCDMDPAAHPVYSPPEAFCRWVCERFAEYVWRRKYGLRTPDQRGLFLMSGGDRLSGDR